MTNSFSLLPIAELKTTSIIRKNLIETILRRSLLGVFLNLSLYLAFIFAILVVVVAHYRNVKFPKTIPLSLSQSILEIRELMLEIARVAVNSQRRTLKCCGRGEAVILCAGHGQGTHTQTQPQL